MEISSHVKTQWSLRGDYTKTVTDAWTQGDKVRLPNYNHGDAMFDKETKIALLSNGNKITTAIRCYEHVEMLPLDKVECEDCGENFREYEECPSCGSLSWRK